MLRSKLLLVPALLLGSMVLVSGSAAAVADPTYTFCRNLKFQEEGEPGLLWILYVPRDVVNAGLAILRDTLPDDATGSVPTSMTTYEQICINFLSICGPVWGILE